MAHEWQKKTSEFGSRYRLCVYCGAQQEWAGEWYSTVGRCDANKTLADHILKFVNDHYMGKSTTIGLYNHFKASSHDEIDSALAELADAEKIKFGRIFTSASGDSEGQDIMVIK